MESIHIPRLTRAPQQTEVIEFDQPIPGLETLTPVKGSLKVTHKGNYLEVSAQAEAIVTLTCHRCLQQYNYKLAISPTELIWLNDETSSDFPPLDQDLAPEDLVETLPPRGYFNPETWLYEQLCLELPHRQLCDQNCQGIELPQQESDQALKDQRWASLEALKRQIANN